MFLYSLRPFVRVRRNPYSGPFVIELVERARKSMKNFAKKDKKFLGEAQEALKRMATDLFHPSLYTKRVQGLKCLHGKDLFECRVNIHKRVYWCYSLEDSKTLVINDVGDHL